MDTWNIVLLVYICVGAVIGLPLARIYWKDFRSSNHKANVILPKAGRIDFNRIIDSFVFMIAWVVLIPLYPLYIIELFIKKGDRI